MESSQGFLEGFLVDVETSTSLENRRTVPGRVGPGSFGWTAGRLAYRRERRGQEECENGERPGGGKSITGPEEPRTSNRSAWKESSNPALIIHCSHLSPDEASSRGTTATRLTRHLRDGASKSGGEGSHDPISITTASF